MSEELLAVKPEQVEQVQIHLLAEDTPEVRAQKSWAILGGSGPVNPTFQKIFEAYLALDKQEWDKAAAEPELPGLMAG